MRFDLRFKEKALTAGQRQAGDVREQFKKKLSERLAHTCDAAARLSGHPDRYKIKWRNAGFRLVYEVCDAEVGVLVAAIGKRERNAVYDAVAKQ